MCTFKECFLEEASGSQSRPAKSQETGELVTATFFPGDLRWILSTARDPLFFRPGKSTLL